MHDFSSRIHHPIYDKFESPLSNMANVPAPVVAPAIIDQVPLNFLKRYVDLKGDPKTSLAALNTPEANVHLEGYYLAEKGKIKADSTILSVKMKEKGLFNKSQVSKDILQPLQACMPHFAEDPYANFWKGGADGANSHPLVTKFGLYATAKLALAADVEDKEKEGDDKAPTAEQELERTRQLLAAERQSTTRLENQLKEGQKESHCQLTEADALLLTNHLTPTNEGQPSTVYFRVMQHDDSLLTPAGARHSTVAMQKYQVCFSDYFDTHTFLSCGGGRCFLALKQQVVLNLTMLATQLQATRYANLNYRYTCLRDGPHGARLLSAIQRLSDNRRPFTYDADVLGELIAIHMTAMSMTQRCLAENRVIIRDILSWERFPSDFVLGYCNPSRVTQMEAAYAFSSPYHDASVPGSPRLCGWSTIEKDLGGGTPLTPERRPSLADPATAPHVLSEDSTVQRELELLLKEVKDLKRKRPQGGFNSTCFNCGRRGHRAADCRQEKNPEGAKKRREDASTGR